MTFDSVQLKNQRGILLLEAMIAIVIFSLGVLGLIGLQSVSVKQSSDAKFRSDASMLADELIGRIWVSDRTAATVKANFSSPDGAAYLQWVGDASKPGSVLATLPGADAHLPDVKIDTVAGGGGGADTSAVSITLYWKAPYENGAEHQYTVTTRIR